MKKHRLVNYLFVAPCVFAFVMVVIIPFFLGVYYSLTDWNGFSPNSEFVGFKNYVGLFSKPSFIYSFLITIAFTVINIVLVNVVSFFMSLLVTSNVRFKNFYRAGFFVPYLIGGIVLGYIWQFIFNQAIVSIGNQFSIEFLEKSLLANPNLVIWVMSFVNTWQYSGYIMLIFVAAIQGIPSSLLEAAAVDGATPFMRIRKIVIPMMANAFTISLFLTLTNSFKQYDMNFSLTGGGPATRFLDSPVNSSQLFAMDIVKTAGSSTGMAVAQAKAVIFFVVLVGVSLVQVKINKSKEVEM